MQMTLYGQTWYYPKPWKRKSPLLLFFLLFSLSSFSQQVSLSFNNTPLEEAFREIERKTDYRFIYAGEEIKLATPVTLKITSTSIEAIMNRLLERQHLSFSINKKYISIFKKEERKATHLTESGRGVRGRVLGERGEGIAGASVIVKGSANATATEEDGSFSLQGVDEKAVLIISSIGYKNREISLNGRTNLEVVLDVLVSSLDETVVIAYGTTTKRLNTGSISKISAEEIAKQPVSNPIATLQGRVPGLVVTETSGLPGSSFLIQVRGQNTINPSISPTAPPLDNPLFIIDGVPFAPQNANINLFQSMAAPGINALYSNAYGGISPFNNINPADIESIEILRDADATAIYGSRGANGVVLITTKKGRSGKTRFQMNGATGISRITRSMPLMKTAQYLEMRKEAFLNDGLTPNLTLFDRGYAPDLLIFDSARSMDWKDYFFGGTASTTDINGSLSGGTATTQFLIGSGYRHDSYIFPGDFGNNRGSINLNLHHSTLDQRFSLDFSSNFSATRNNSSRSPSALTAFTLPPNYPDLIDANGNLNWTYKGLDLYDNPLAYTKQPYSLTARNLISSLQLNYRLLKGLYFRSNFGYNLVTNREVSKLPKSSQDPSQSPRGSASFGSNDFETWIAEPRIEYKKALGRKTFTLLAGGTVQRNSNTQNTVSGFNYANDNLMGSITGAANTVVSDSYNEYKYAALYARLNFNWANRYLVNLNGRRDGSSRFGPGKQFGNFGSLGLGWIFSEESFLKKSFKPLSYGKLRMSYGTTGSDNIGDYQYIPRWAPSLSYSGIPGYIPQNLFNPGFSWSVNRKLEAGLELGFFSDRVLASVVWYRHRTNNQLISYQLPGQTGFTSVTANFPATIQNKGWEMQLTTVNVKTKNFNWTSSFNLTIPKNTLLAFPGMENTPYKSRYVIGQSLNVINVFRYLGISDSSGMYVFESGQGEPTSNPVATVDYFVQGSLDPSYYGGLGNNLTYKGFGLDLFLQFARQLGRNYLQQTGNVPPGNYGNQPVAVLDRWQVKGGQPEVEKFTSNNRTDAAKAALALIRSSGAYSDASYLRLKTVSLNYSLSGKGLKQLHLEGCQFYLNAQNLLTLTGYKGNDPETQSFFSVPPLKTLVAGIRITF